MNYLEIANRPPHDIDEIVLSELFGLFDKDSRVVSYYDDFEKDKDGRVMLDVHIILNDSELLIGKYSVGKICNLLNESLTEIRERLAVTNAADKKRESDTKKAEQEETKLFEEKLSEHSVNKSSLRAALSRMFYTKCRMNKHQEKALELYGLVQKDLNIKEYDFKAALRYFKLRSK